MRLTTLYLLQMVHRRICSGGAEKLLQPFIQKNKSGASQRERRFFF
jgi:hypothetical protein